MGKFDQTFKSLAEADPHALLGILGLIPLGADVAVTSVGREVTLPHLQVDHAYRLESPTPWICHLEEETWPKAMSLELIAKRALALYQKFWIPVATTIVLVNPKRPAWNLPDTWQGGGMSIEFRFSVRIVRTWQLDPRVILKNTIPAALPWVGAFDASERQIREAWRRIGSVEPEDVRRRLAAELAVLLGLRYNGVEIARLLGGKNKLLSPYVVSESSVVKPLLEESRNAGIEQGMEQGMEQGIERGLEQGIERGELSEARRLLRVVLSSRFPDGEDIPGLDLIEDLRELESLVEMAVSATREQVVSRIRTVARKRKRS